MSNKKKKFLLVDDQTCICEIAKEENGFFVTLRNIQLTDLRAETHINTTPHEQIHIAGLIDDRFSKNVSLHKTACIDTLF